MKRKKRKSKFTVEKLDRTTSVRQSSSASRVVSPADNMQPGYDTMGMVLLWFPPQTPLSQSNHDKNTRQIPAEGHLPLLLEMIKVTKNGKSKKPSLANRSLRRHDF